MIKKNRFSKYILYAFGEIILVTIGILIALSINNWNETKKQDKQILKALSEVRDNLIGDSLAISNTLKLKLEDIEIQTE